MNNIKKLIQMLKEYQKSYIGHDYIFYDIKFCNPQVQMCIEALEKQLNGCWIPVSDGKYIIEVKEGEVVSCQNFEI